MRGGVWFVCLALSYLLGTVQGTYSAAKETEIRSETVLDASYDMISRPEAQTIVKVGISILAIDELDLKSQKFEAAGWVTFEWEDSRLTWTPSAKDDIEEIFSKPGDIWKPELFVDNSMEDLGIITNSDLYLRVKYTGLVEWDPPRRFVTHCEVDITYYPYDKQSCSIGIASLGYTAEEVLLEALSTPINLDDFEIHGEWVITSSSAEKTNLTETLDDGSTRLYSSISFKLEIERRTAYYNLNVVMPIFVTSVLVALTFIVPVDSGEKLSYILTVFLALAVLLTLVADSLPSTSITISLLGVYLGMVTVLSAVGILLTVLILILYHKEGNPASHSCIMVITRFASRFRRSRDSVKVDKTRNCVSPISVDTEEANCEKNEEKTEEMTWKEVSMILDRFCFIIFTLVTLCINVSCVIALAVGSDLQN